MRWIAPAVLIVCAAVGCARDPSVIAQSAVVARSSPVVPANATYRSPDGSFSFQYPRPWHVEDHWPSSMSFLSSFTLGASCCDLTPGDVKMDFGAMPTSDAEAASLTFATRCRGAYGERVQSCRTVDVHDVAWGWVEARTPAYGATLYAFAARGGREYVAAAYSGDPSGASLEAAEAIFRTFELH